VARADILPDESKESAVAFLLATVAYFKSLGVNVERVMTDNGSCYRSKAFARACKAAPQAHQDKALYAADQRQGRAIHPDRAARMGLRHSLRALRAEAPGAPALAPSLQLAQAPC